MRTIDWVDGEIELIDQTLLPAELVFQRIADPDELIAAIRRLAVRGAPALGVAGALGVALLARLNSATDVVRAGAATLSAARPTAVNLSWGVERALSRLDQGPAAVLEEALAIRDADVAACRAMGEFGADLAQSLVCDKPIRALTICNTGGLCAVERGTALGVIQTLYERGHLDQVLAAETRPLLQGARLTSWELERMGARYRIVVDSAAPFLLARGLADIVIIGADRIVANGDTANKIGSFSLALAARHASVPFVVAAPESTIDLRTADGSGIEIEDRGSEEIIAFRGMRIAPEGAQAINPAFDVTPHDLITAIVTDTRVIHTSAGETPSSVAAGSVRYVPA